jgi:hypothetical protein
MDAERPQRGRPRRRHRPHLDPGASGLILQELSGPASIRVRQRFDAALATGPADGAMPGHEPVLEALSQATTKRIGEVPYGSNAVFLLELDAPDPAEPDAPMRAIYKPMRGERTLWDFPRSTLFLREVAAYLVDAALGIGHVPPTALRDTPFGPGSAQLFVAPAQERVSGRDLEALEEQLRDIAALDVLINNADRKRSHLMLARDGRVRAIDNALSFLPYPRQRTALIALGGSPLADGLTRRLQAIAADTERLEPLRARLSRLLSGVEVDAFVNRVGELADDPTFPVLDDWDGRPFEWW